MRTRVIPIGNSHGVRIPKSLLEEANLGDEVELSVNKRQIVISPIQKAREGWEAAFKAMHEIGEDTLLDVPVSTSWDDEEWVW